MVHRTFTKQSKSVFTASLKGVMDIKLQFCFETYNLTGSLNLNL